MTPFLTAVLTLSLSMSAVIALLLLLGPLLARRYRPHWRYWAWLGVALRLLLPLSLPQAPIQLEVPPADHLLFSPPASPVSVRPAADAAGAGAGAPLVTPALEPLATSALSAGLSAPDQAPVQRSDGPGLTLGTALTALWVLGAAGMLLWHLLGLARFARYVRRWAVPLDCPEALALRDALCTELGLRRRVPVWLCPGVDSPMLAGLLRPVILLPQQPPQGEDLWFALRHELLHYRRRDIPYKTLLLLANCVHWFNPLVWLMRRAADRDMELCCDAGVIAGLSHRQRVDYGQAILTALNRAAGCRPTH